MSLPGNNSDRKGCFGKDADSRSGLFKISFFPAGGSSGGEITLINDRERRYSIKVDFILGTVALIEGETT